MFWMDSAVHSVSDLVVFRGLVLVHFEHHSFPLNQPVDYSFVSRHGVLMETDSDWDWGRKCRTLIGQGLV